MMFTWESCKFALTDHENSLSAIPKLQHKDLPSFLFTCAESQFRTWSYAISYSSNSYVKIKNRNCLSSIIK